MVPTANIFCHDLFNYYLIGLFVGGVEANLRKVTVYLGVLVMEQVLVGCFVYLFVLNQHHINMGRGTFN